METGRPVEEHEDYILPTEAKLENTATSGKISSIENGAISSIEPVPDWCSYFNFSEITDGESWQAPEPWSPKPLTPTRDTEFKFPETPHNSRFYGSPQKNWTPPKLPACSHRVTSAPPGAKPVSLHSTPAPLVPGKPQGPPPGKNSSSPVVASATPSPRRSISDTSGYSSNSSGFLGFSPPSLALVDELDDEAIDLMPLGSPSAKDWDLYGSILGIGGSPGRIGQQGDGQGQDGEEDTTPRAQTTPFSDVSDSDIIYEGTSYLDRRATLSPRSPDILLYSPNSSIKSPLFGDNLTPTGGNPISLRGNTNQSKDIDLTINHNDKLHSGNDSNDLEHTGDNDMNNSPVCSSIEKKSPPPGKAKDAPKSDGEKPKEPYIALISKILLENHDQKLILQDIYDTLQEKYAYFKTAETSWRNVVRHNLSINECFIKAGRASSGRGFFWAIHPACVEMFKSGDFRRREAKRLVQQSKENKMVSSERPMVTTPVAVTSIPLANHQSQFSNITHMPKTGYTYTFPSVNTIGQTRRVFEQSQFTPYGLPFQPRDRFTNVSYSTITPGQQNHSQCYSKSAPS